MRRQAYSRALAHLTKRIAGQPDRGDSRLPRIDALARTCGVSRVTMWRAVRELVTRGQLTAAPRRGIRISDLGRSLPATVHEVSQAAPPQPTGQSWQRLQRRLGRDIQSGSPGPGQMLPSYKEIARTYGITHATTRRALDGLCADRVIEPSGRHYRVRMATPRNPLTTVVFVPGLQGADWVSEATVRSAQFIQAMERESHTRRFAVRTVSCRQLVRRLHSLHDAGKSYVAEDQQSVAGFLVWSTSINPQMSRELFSLLRAERRPVAVLEESASRVEYRSLVASPLFRYYFLGTGASHGEEAGAYLLQRGHRRVAFFSAVRMERWVLHRYEGLRDIYARNGLQDAVVLFSPHTHARESEVITAVLSESGAGDPAATLKQLRAFADTVYAPSTAPLKQDPWPQHLLRRCCARLLKPVFEQALLDTTITAWVLAEDNLGLAALDFLAGTPAARRIAVVSFDNTRESLQASLTSYDFNLALIVQRMLHHLLSPVRRVSVAAPQIEPVPGIMVERASSLVGP